MESEGQLAADKMTENSDKPHTADSAGVRIPPPLIFLVFLAGGIWVDSPWFDGALAPLPAMVAGGVLFAVAIVLIIIAGGKHFAAGSHVEPWKPTTTIIRSGIYGYSRNPMYLGMAVAQIGIAIAAGSWVGALGVIPSVVLIQWYVIGREERYLTAKFGQSYLDYKRSVRRWI